MKNKQERYAKEEDDVIIEMISRYPSNLGFAFNEAAKVLGRSESGIANYYYRHLKNKRNAVALVTTEGAMMNVKQARRPKTRRQGLSALEVAIIAVKNMSVEERKELLRAIMED
jgi:hypothetical protein